MPQDFEIIWRKQTETAVIRLESAEMFVRLPSSSKLGWALAARLQSEKRISRV